MGPICLLSVAAAAASRKADTRASSSKPNLCCPRRNAAKQQESERERGKERKREREREIERERETLGCVVLARTLRAVVSDPAGVALAGAINGVAGAVVGTEADLSTGLPIAATGAHCHTTQTHTHTHTHTHPHTQEDTHTYMLTASTEKTSCL